jgi:HEAT repeat protein
MLRHCALYVLLSAFLSLSLAGQDPNSPDAKERKRAAQRLAEQGPDAIPTLQNLLSDQDLDVRVEAVKAIVQIDTQHSLDPLVLATRDNDPEIQIRATDGLVNFYLPGYIRTGFTASLRRAGKSIKGKFTDTNDQVIDPFIEVRPEIIEALGKLARGGSSMESRANAARAVGILRGKAAVPDLLQAVRSKDTQVIYEGLIAFQKIGDRSAGPQLTFLLRDLDKRVQIAAVETAGLLYNRQALPQLRQLLSQSGKKDVRRATLRSIAMLRDPADRDLFKTYLRHKDEELREAAAEGLGRIEDSADRPILEQTFANEKKNSPRVSMAFALVMMGNAEMSEFSPLQYLVNTLNSDVRALEARALLIEAARKAEVRRALEQPLMRGTSSERIHLSQVMARSGDRETIPLLEQLSLDADVRVAQEALRALRTLKARLP